MIEMVNLPEIDWMVLGPYLWLTGGALLVTLISVGPRMVRGYAAPLALLALIPPAIGLVSLWDVPAGRDETLSGMLVLDHFAICFHLIFLLTAAVTILLSMPTPGAEWSVNGEYYSLLLFSVSGMMLMSASRNLLMVFLGLEILSLPLYILVGYTRWRDQSLESSMKDFLLGAFSTGFTVYGMALLYGATGTLDVGAMTVEGTGGGRSTMVLLGFGLAVIGFLFKIAAFPFHYWLPDVYQGAPTPVTAFMIATTKAAAFAVVLRIVTARLFWSGPISEDWVKLLIVLSALTMTTGNAVALVQRNIKRMLAYSSIAHGGYILVAVVARSEAGLSSVVFYLAAYLFMNLGAFGVILAIDRARGGVGEGDLISSYAGLGRRHPALAAAMTLFMLSLTGIPLTAGFVGKFYIFKAAVDSSLYGIAVVGLLNSVLAAAYYLNIVLTMYMKEPVSEPPAVHTPAPLRLGIAIGVAGVLYLGVFPARVLEFAQKLLL